MADITNPKSISQSLTLKSAVAIAVALVAGHFNVLSPEGAAQTLASSLIDLISKLGLPGVAIGRVRAKGSIT